MSATALTLDQQREAATKDGKVKYPLDCGCKGETYYALCAYHQAEYHQDQARRMGIVDLKFTHRDFTDLPCLVKTLQAIKLQLISNPTKPCLIQIVPGGNKP